MLHRRACLSQFAIQCQEVKSTRSVATSMICHSCNSPYNGDIKDGIFLDEFLRLYQMNCYITFQVNSILLTIFQATSEALSHFRNTSVILKGPSPFHCFPFKGLLPCLPHILLLKSQNVVPACQFLIMVQHRAHAVVVRKGGDKLLQDLS